VIPGWSGQRGIRMTSDSQLREKLRKIEALFVGAGTAGERLASFTTCSRRSTEWNRVCAI
jgi:hypothetical protein